MPEPTLPTAAEWRKDIAIKEAARDKQIDDIRKAHREKANGLIDELRKKYAAILKPRRACLKTAEADEAANAGGNGDE